MKDNLLVWEKILKNESPFQLPQIRVERISINEKKQKQKKQTNKKTKKDVSYKLKFFDSTRFMASLLSNLVNNLAGGIHPIK